MSCIQRATWLLLFAAAPPVAFAQPCDPAQTALQCWTAIRSPGDTAAVRSAAAELSAAQKKEVLAKPAGQDTGGTSLQSTTKNFLPWLALTALLGEGDVEDNDGELVADLNFLLPIGLKGKNSQLQLIAKTEPAVAGDVTQALPEATREELGKALGEEVSATDDVAFSYTFSVQGLNRGRDFALYRNRYQALTRPFLDRVAAEPFGYGPGLLAFERVIAGCPSMRDDPDAAAATFAHIATKCGEAQAVEARTAVADAARSFAASMGDLRSDLSGAGLDKFAALVANQPQFHLSVVRRERDPLVGTDGTAVKVTYEYADINLRSTMTEDCHELLEDRGTTVDTRDARFVDCAAAYRAYVRTNGAAIANSQRFSFSLEYETADSATVPLSTLLPDAGVADLRLPETEKRIAAVGWSRNFGSVGGQPTRLDIVGRYEDVSNDPTRQDRLVATATLNLKIGSLDVPLGIVYANHGEYLGEVDEQLSTHFGLKINLDPSP